MGGKTTSTTEAKIADIKLQTSAYGGVLPIVFGTTRIAGNVLWYGNFTPIATTASTSSGGKGLGKVTSKSTTYTYTAAVMLGLAEGPIAGVGAVWKGKDKTTLTALGLTLFAGARGQAAWSFRTGYNGIAANIARENAYGFAGQSVSFAASTVLGYSSTAYLAASAYDLGADASVPNHGFEVQGLAIFGGGIVDANPKDIVTPFLTGAQFGAGLNPALLGPLTNFGSYCTAAGLFFSPAYVEQRAAADHLKALTDAANTALVWSEGVLKFVPYGDATITGNGVTYTPNVTPAYDLTDDNFLANGNDPVHVARAAPADAFNRIQVEYLDRANQYNTAIVSVEDQAAIELYGLRPAPVAQAHMICDASVAKIAAQLMLQNGLYKRNSYTFSLPASFALLEPMGIVTLTTGDMVRVPVRIISIEEDGDDFALTAEDFPLGIASAALYQHDSGLHYQSALNITPQSCAAPIIFELPADPSATGLSVAIAAGGQTTDPLYGGCRVWLSLDGTNYKAEGVIYGSSRYGTTTASLPAATTGTDVTNTLALALRSNGQLISGSGADLAKGTTLIVLDGEYLAYQTATLTGTNTYNLTTLNRGLYGTTGGLHASGAAWVRVDSAVSVLKDLDLTMIGQTVYIKVTAFNTFAAGEQDLSAVTAYTYTITGNMKALQTPVDFATRVGGSAKPANNATRNVVTYSTTAPTTPVDGDLWVDLSGTFAVFKLRSGGAWVIGANALSVYNTLSGKPIALADISTTESSKLAGIAAGADVTSAHVAAAITGQGSLATLNSVDWATQLTGAAKVSGNLLPDPITLSGLWFPDSNASLQVNSTGGRLADKYRVYMTASTYFSWLLITETKRIPVYPGQAVYYQHAVFTTNAVGSTRGLYNAYDATGAYLATYEFTGSSALASVSPGTWVTVKGANTMPADVAYIWPHAAGVGLTSDAYFGEPYVGYQAAGATVGAIAGTNLYRADGTSIGNADNSQVTVVGGQIGGIGTGSGAFVDNSQMSISRPASSARLRLLRGGGGLFDLDLTGDTVFDNSTQQWSVIGGTGKPYNYADVTLANTSSGFTGQGALATLSTVDYATQVTGKPAGLGMATVGSGQVVQRYLAASQSWSVTGGYGATGGSTGFSTIYTTLLANGSVFATSSPGFVNGPGEPGSDTVSATFTNGGTAQLVSFSVGHSGGSGVAPDTTQIFITA
jgi:hypothetical protein